MPAAIVGATSVVWPELPGTLGRTGGALAVLWAVLFIVVAEREALIDRRRLRPPAASTSPSGGER